MDDADFLYFEQGVSGPTVPVESSFEDRDLDGDNNADLYDFAVFQRCFSGEDNPGDSNCSQ